MQSKPWRQLISRLEAVGISFEEGLSDEEIKTAESQYDFRFPADLREFLQTAIPIGDKFPNWRLDDESRIRQWLNLPLDGILFDIEFNDFWLEEWGPRPQATVEALEVARNLIATAPKLIPVFTHRMMPNEPETSGNPVFSVHQTDIIIYGNDLTDYLCSEFRISNSGPVPEQARQIRFWNLDRFQEVRWKNGSCVFDNRKGQLPK